MIMLVSTSGQIQPLAPLMLPEEPVTSVDQSGNISPARISPDLVSISDAGRVRLAQEMEHVAKARENQTFVDLRGGEGKFRLGLMALGANTVEDWAGKGLALSEDAIFAAADAFQAAFRKTLDANGSATAGSAIVLNRHQIVMNSQTVPGWFVQEYQSILSSLDSSGVGKAFASGETFFATQPSLSKAEALASYAAVAKAV